MRFRIIGILVAAVICIPGAHAQSNCCDIQIGGLQQQIATYNVPVNANGPGGTYVATQTVASTLRASPPIGAVVQTMEFDGKQITVGILNSSEKEITAVSLAVVLTRPNGETAAPYYDSVDFIGGIISSAMLGYEVEPGASHGIKPKDVRYVTFAAPEPNATYHANVDVVVYANGTADVLSKVAFQAIVGQRKGTLSAYEKATQLMAAALANADDPHPSLTVANQLKALVDADQKSGGTFMGTGLLDAAQNLRNTPKDPAGRSVQEDNRIRELITEYKGRISLLSPHSALTHGVQP